MRKIRTITKTNELTKRSSFKTCVVPILSIITKVIVILSILNILKIFLQTAIIHPLELLNPISLRTLLGSILFVVLALELDYLLENFAREERVNVPLILAVVLIAFSRKLLRLDLEKTDILTILSASSVILVTGTI